MDVGSSSQAPRETRESSQSQLNFVEILLKSFEALQARVDEGFLELVGEVPPTTEPTVEAPLETAPTAEVLSTDPPVTDEVIRTDDPVAEGVTEVDPTAADQIEEVQVATVKIRIDST
ncbi:hypothetical protein PIB30_022120 [Stylosanthes scabra]|uniref:Uncharacterized protein n=1 Tax=Stylosanthes scabra TaxID=79078 RepID=A0ABU6T8S7_9FABA|nr:hypothetical protein [Stylosanthes scabra]